MTTNNTAVSVVPVGLALPAHLQTPDAAAQIAAANAAASGGIKTGGFASISIKGGKFHEKVGGELKTYMLPALPGQPALPMMCLEAVIIAANPVLTKTYFAGEYVEGADSEPVCSSNNGMTPDAHIVNKQSPTCATCPQNQWGSKISKMSGKDIKACDDSKQLVILPAGDLGYKALGFSVTKSALTDWGKYVKALSERGIPVNSVVTNVTFDHTASYPKVQFAYNRFLTPEEYAKVQERALGDDVKAIVTPARQIALPAPAAPAPAPSEQFVPPAPVAPVAPAPMQAGFGATVAPAATPVAETATSAEGAKRKRRTRAEIEADAAAAGQPATPAPLTADPFAGQPAHVAPAVNAAGGLGTPGGDAVYKALTGMGVSPANPLAVPIEVMTPISAHAPVAQPAPVGFGGSTAVAPEAPSAAVVSSAGSLKDILAKKLGLSPGA